MRTFFCLLAGILLHAGASFADPIECPGGQAIRDKVTTALPAGWWATPMIPTVTAAKISVEGTEVRLVCEYKPRLPNIASVMIPAGATCKARTGGFDCTTGPIECPAGPLRRELSPLPAGWESPPWVQALSGTRVNAAAKALLCFYGPETFSPLSAKVRICTARAGGFDCALPKGR